MGGYITLNGTVIMSWSIYVATCPNVAYAEVRSIYEGINRAHLLGFSAANLCIDSELLWNCFSQLYTDNGYD